MLDAQQRIENILGPYIELQSRIQQAMENVYAPLKNIDWEGLKEAAVKRISY